MLDTAAMLFGSLDRQQELGNEAASYVGRAVTMLRRERALVEDDRLDAAALIGRRRDAMATLLGGYQRFKHGCIFDPVVAHGTASSRIVARVMKAECVIMGQAFGDHHARWAGADAASQWRGYRREAIAIIDRLLDHLEVERLAMEKLLVISGMYAQPR